MISYLNKAILGSFYPGAQSLMVRASQWKELEATASCLHPVRKPSEQKCIMTHFFQHGSTSSCFHNHPIQASSCGPSVEISEKPDSIYFRCFQATYDLLFIESFFNESYQCSQDHCPGHCLTEVGHMATLPVAVYYCRMIP